MDKVEFDNGSKKRRSIRLPEYDYGQAGAYFITVAAYHRKCVFGDIVNGEVRLSKMGVIVKTAWQELPAHFPNVINDEYVIMPNHLHGIIRIETDIVGARHASPLRECVKNSGPRGTAPLSLGAIIGSFKSAASKRIHEIQGFEHFHLWQRNYYEHVIRDERDYERVLEYIRSNPMNWEQDLEYQF